MILFLFLWRIVAIPLSLSVYVIATLALAQDPINFTLLIVACVLGYLLSLSTLMRAAHRKVMYRGGGYRAFIYFLMLIATVPAMPVALMISVFGRIFRLFNYNTYERDYDENSPAMKKLLAKRELKENAKAEREAQRKEAKELASAAREDAKETKRRLRGKSGLEKELITNDYYKRRSEMLGVKQSKADARRAASATEISDRIRSSMWRASADRAVKKILDDSYKGDIRIDDGVDAKIYKQVALIKLNMQKYALLAEYDESGIPSREADIFAIVPDSTKGNTLVLVEDKELGEKIFSVYRTLLAEKRLYNA